MNKALRGTNRIKSLLRAAAVWSAAGILCALLFPGAFLRAYAAPGDSGEQPSTGADTVVIRVEGEIGEIDRGALVERLNAIRREACEEGIDNPVNGTPLSMNDYVPVEWSYALEEIAVLRAAESTILQDHMRPDGTECFSLLPDSNVYSMETLAWGYGSTMGAVEGWYSEKEAYVGETGAPAGPSRPLNGLSRIETEASSISPSDHPASAACGPRKRPRGRCWSEPSADRICGFRRRCTCWMGHCRTER